MKLTIEKQTISTGEVNVIATSEQAIQCDVLLPDYYPDISRILCCNVMGVINNTQCRGDKLTIDGMGIADVCYCSEDGQMRATQYRVPFSRVVQLKEGYHVGAVDVLVSSTNIGCRAISRRRIDISGTLSIIVRTCDTKEAEIVCHAEGMGVQIQNAEDVGVKILAQLQRPVQLADQFPLPQGMVTPLVLVSTNSRPIIEECRCVGGRVVVKGSLEMTILCQQEEEKKVIGLKHSLPFTCLLEAPSMAENPQCDVRVRVLSCEANYQGEYNPEKRDIAITAQLDVDVKLYLPCTYKGVTDSYSTCYEMTPTYQMLTIPQLDKMIDLPINVNNRFELPEDASEVIDITMIPTHENMEVVGNTVNVGCRMLVSMMCKSKEQGFECFERTWEIKETIPMQMMEGKLEMHPSFEIDSVDWSIEGDMITVKSRIVIRGAPVFYKKARLLSNIIVDGTKPLEKDMQVGLMIYYPIPGEQVWEIAKRYNTNAMLILEQNELASVTIQDSSPLIIPSA